MPVLFTRHENYSLTFVMTKHVSILFYLVKMSYFLFIFIRTLGIGVMILLERFLNT
jgi:hypothetical protein